MEIKRIMPRFIVPMKPSVIERFSKDNGLCRKDSCLFRHYTFIKRKAQPGNEKSLEKDAFLEDATKKLRRKTAPYRQKLQRIASRFS